MSANGPLSSRLLISVCRSKGVLQLPVSIVPRLFGLAQHLHKGFLNPIPPVSSDPPLSADRPSYIATQAHPSTARPGCCQGQALRALPVGRGLDSSGSPCCPERSDGEGSSAFSLRLWELILGELDFFFPVVTMAGFGEPFDAKRARIKNHSCPFLAQGLRPKSRRRVEEVEPDLDKRL